MFDLINRYGYIRPMSVLEKASQIVGSQAKLAKKLGVHPMAITHWKKRGVPPKRCKEIEAATGGQISRAELRPDIFGDGA